MSQIPDTAYEASLKSLETENYIDRLFYRPAGFHIAKRLINTGITPNMITVFSIFVGAAAGPLFYRDSVCLALAGILCLITANLLDCVDGQLARLTNTNSKIGRILDGLAGDIWFFVIYVSLALRLKNEYGNWLFFIPAVVSGLSHLVQANITDYYKTLHLYFISKEKGNEFQNHDDVRMEYQQMKPGIGKVLFYFYLSYTSLQEALTPKLQKMLRHLHVKYANNIPANIRTDFREKSKKLMHACIDWMTFNGRTFILFLSVLIGMVWIYFIFEIIVLNVILFLSVHKHEKICLALLLKDEANGFRY